jgi:hypothetical protein
VVRRVKTLNSADEASGEQKRETGREIWLFLDGVVQRIEGQARIGASRRKKAGR